MKFLVLGHICVDIFDQNLTPSAPIGDGEIRWGGIFFSLATLANLAEDATICPVFGVGEKEYAPLLERLRRYTNVDPSGIYRLAEPTNTVYLLYQDGEQRVECSRSIAPPIPLDRIEAFLPVDAVLVNMISGFDLTLDTLSELRVRTQTNGTLLHLDLHSLTLGIDEEFRRFRQPLETWRRWCYLADTVQMNEEEAKALPLEYLQEEDLVKQILSLGLHGCIITRGAHGATVWSQDHKRIMRTDLSPISVPQKIDSTGCGDVFAAAFCYHFAAHQKVALAAEYANHIAAMNVAYVGSDGIDTLAEARRHTGELR
jgi:sugar/nucleoside kinase (ribokinase family)